MDMGGRYYDPYLARFAAPDPFVSAPTSSQGYDPFSYVRNDPLTYTDPSGYVPVSGYEGDWNPEGTDTDSVSWFSCIEGCGDLDVIGVSADSVLESAVGAQLTQDILKRRTVPADEVELPGHYIGEPGFLWMMPATTPPLIDFGNHETMSEAEAAQLRETLGTMWGSNAGSVMSVYAGIFEFTTGLDHPYNNVPPDVLNKPGGVRGGDVAQMSAETIGRKIRSGEIDLPDSVLYRLGKTDAKGDRTVSGGVGAPGVRLQSTYLRNASRIDTDQHGDSQYECWQSRKGALGSQTRALVGFRTKDPISSRGLSEGGLNVTGGHHKVAEIQRRVANGTLPASTAVMVLLHD